MNELQSKSSTYLPSLPADDPGRSLTLVDPEDWTLPHVGLVGDTYTVLLSGKQTAGRYSLIDMYVPPGGGPPLHRHDFEEMFHVLEGSVEVTFRGNVVALQQGQTVNVPANAPHAFRNTGEIPARLLCLVSPAGMDEFFMAVGTGVATRTTPSPKPDAQAMARLLEKANTLAPMYRIENLPAF